MPVKYLPWITRAMLRAEPQARFVFGDNAERIGYGGQAAAMRDEPNAIGVATLYAPGGYYRADDPLALATVVDDLGDVALALNQGLTVYVPTDGLGTGLARLPENAPALHRLIVAFFRAAPGEPCPWKDI
ncbi:hypothetical protein [Mesorhizobium sp.]|uniref:DUF7831 domain-containing protein n=1 Tax=Mesorhizobium sp. TaxID=1871066 RepID=UPI0011F77B5F|nr:hypothetical protein [Mesorhizobium sp.]TIX23872.1 MAG: hypothetical protein E5V35_20485 [Mesorhizobium sp.]